MAEIAPDDWLDESRLFAWYSAAYSVDRNKLVWGPVHVCLSFLVSTDFIDTLMSLQFYQIFSKNVIQEMLTSWSMATCTTSLICFYSVQTSPDLSVLRGSCSECHGSCSRRHILRELLPAKCSGILYLLSDFAASHSTWMADSYGEKLLHTMKEDWVIMLFNKYLLMYCLRTLSSKATQRRPNYPRRRKCCFNTWKKNHRQEALLHCLKGGSSSKSVPLIP